MQGSMDDGKGEAEADKAKAGENGKKGKGCGCGSGCATVFGLLLIISSIMSCMEEHHENTTDDEEVEIRDSGMLGSFLKINFGESFKDEKWKGRHVKDDWVKNPDGGFGAEVFKCLVAEVPLEKPLFPISGFDTAKVYAGVDGQRIFMIKLDHKEDGGNKQYGITGNAHTDEYRKAFREMMKAKYGLKHKEKDGDEYRHKNVLVKFESYLVDLGGAVTRTGYYTHHIAVSATNLDLAKLAEQEAHNAKVREKRKKEEEAESRAKKAANSGIDLL